MKEPDAKGAVYLLRFDVDGETFAQGKVGGRTGKLEDLNDTSISSHSQEDKLYLVALGPGQTAELSVTLEIDGDSMENEYMNTAGKLELGFGVQYQDSPADPEEPDQTDQTGEPVSPVKPGETPSNSYVVKTGDPDDLFQTAVLCGFSFLLLITVLWKKGEKEK